MDDPHAPSPQDPAPHESRDVVALAMRAGRMGAWSRDLATGRVWWSRELEELFGVSPGAFAGTEQGFFDFVHPEDRDAVADAVAQAIATRGDYIVEFRHRHANGEWRWMEGRGRATYSADGQPVMLHGVGMDITDRRRAADEMRRLNAELSDAHRRKDEFLATLAHELRNPLAPIRNAIEILRVRDTADVQLTAMRDVLHRQLGHLTRLVDDLLDASRITRGLIAIRRDRIDACEAVRLAVEAAQPAIDRASHRLEVTWPPEPLWIDADATRIAQIVVNLLNNAARYTPRGGRIRVAVSSEGRHVVVSVRDNGIGMRSDELARAFDLFAQFAANDHPLAGASGGLGIGLSLVKALAEIHGGRVTAASEGPNRGCEFVVRLPRVDEAPRRPRPEIALAGLPAERFLVVDDNTDAAESLGTLLELLGHDVRIAFDGRTALETAHDFRPDVALLDIGLPHLSGYEVAQAIRSQPWGQGVYLIAITGWGQAEDKRRAFAAGFDCHLTKPIDSTMLAGALHERRARTPA